jgi:hypothetical protein
MKSIRYLFLTALMWVLLGSASAADNLQSSRSAGKLRQDQSVDISRQLRLSEPLARHKTGQAENYAARSKGQVETYVANRHDQLFDIYEVDMQLLSDLDGDGFHHALNVYFDVDVSVDSATVYAKLYLSREGEPWTQYFTTDLFSIHVDDFSDAYEVETELMEGYVPGYYSVLIEIYSLDHAHMVASEVLDYHTLGKDVMIEDRYRDEPYAESSSEYYEEEYYYSSGGGGFAPLLIFFLIIQVVIAARGSFALSPRDDSEYKNKNKIP